MRKVAPRLYHYVVVSLMTIVLIVTTLLLGGSENVRTSALSWKNAMSLTSVSQMELYEQLIRRAITEHDESSGIVPPRHWVFVPVGGVIQHFCGLDEALKSQDAYVYCSNDDTIYVGAEMMWRFYQISWITPAILMAHEAGHAQQFSTAASWASSVRNEPGGIVLLENQADCISGVWLNWMQSHQKLAQFSATDIVQLFKEVADPNIGVDKTHGTFAERYAQYGKGTTGPNTDVCTAYAL